MTDDSVGQLNFNFHGNVMSFVEEAAMSKQESDLFRESCFGHFLEMPSITRSSKILINLMMRTGYFDGLPKAEDRLHIEIGGVPREFTREDFSLITCLRVDESYKATEYDQVAPGGLYVETFKQGALATRGNIAALIKDSKDWNDVEKRVRFLLLHFLYNVLLPGQRTVAMKNKSYIKMVDDPATFNGFPWGNVVWDHFMLTVRSFVKKAASPSSPSKTKKVHFEAFLLPLQVWAYECIPKLESLGLCTVFKDDARPLILRWSSSARVSESALQSIRLQEVP